LVELVESHRDEIAKCISLQFGQPSLRQLMLYEKPMKPAMLRQASVAQESAHQYLLLPTC
jgi:hypothetical protein